MLGIIVDWIHDKICGMGYHDPVISVAVWYRDKPSPHELTQVSKHCGHCGKDLLK